MTAQGIKYRIYTQSLLILNSYLSKSIYLFLAMVDHWSKLWQTYIGAKGAWPSQAPKFFSNFFLYIYKKKICFVTPIFFYFLFFNLAPHIHKAGSATGSKTTYIILQKQLTCRFWTSPVCSEINLHCFQLIFWIIIC